MHHCGKCFVTIPGIIHLKANQTDEKSGNDNNAARYKHVYDLKTLICSAKWNCLHALLQQSQKFSHLHSRYTMIPG